QALAYRLISFTLYFADARAPATTARTKRNQGRPGLPGRCVARPAACRRHLPRHAAAGVVDFARAGTARCRLSTCADPELGVRPNPGRPAAFGSPHGFGSRAWRADCPPAINRRAAFRRHERRKGPGAFL